MKKNYDVGLYGWWGHENFGGVLTYFALHQTLKSMGYSVLMIQEALGATKCRYQIPDHTVAMDFAKKYYDCSPQLDFTELGTFNETCDTFIVGGDQLWNDMIKFVESDFFLDFVEPGHRKLSYSTSFGEPKRQRPVDFVAANLKNLQEFTAVSVREDYAVDIAKQVFSVDATQIIDAVFLPDISEYTKVADTATVKREHKYLLAFILDATPEKKNVIEKIAKKLSLDIFVIPTPERKLHKDFKAIFSGFDILEDLSVENFLYAYQHAEYIITDSFHGTCFAAVFHKNFSAFYNEKRGASRFMSLNNLLRQENRRIYETATDEDIANNSNIETAVDWNKTDENITQERKKAFIWLKRALTIPPNNTVCPKNLCTGCGACSNACPVSAITMEENSEGFLNPVIDKTACTGCQLCQKKCPSLNPAYKNRPDPTCFAMMAPDDIRQVSSSGGMFTVVAEYVLDQGGSVCGAAFTDDFKVQHIVINKKEDLYRLRGSKYMQSDTAGTFQQTKQLLDHGDIVLYTGMPCQIAGLYAFLDRDYDNLYTIDLFCHGITSSMVFQKYHKEVLDGKQLLEVQFKAKEPWGWHAGVNAKFADDTKYSRRLEEDPFFIAYLNSISKNTVCGICKANQLPRQGDLSIGDFWGLARYKPQLNDNKGTSAVLINNEKSKKLFNQLRDKMQLCEEAPLSAAIQGNHIIEKPFTLSKHRNAFFENISEIDFISLTNGCNSNNLYEMQYGSLVNKLPRDQHEWYYLAKTVAQNARNRKIVVWGWGLSAEFEKVLKEQFGLSVAFYVSMSNDLINNTTVKNLAELIGRRIEFYMVSIGKPYEEADYKRLHDFGFKEIKDFIFRIHKPIVLENYDCSKSVYSDAYGNTVEGYNSAIKKIVLRGCNNHIKLGNNLAHTNNLTFDLTSNVSIRIGDGNRFEAPMQFQTITFGGFSQIVIKNKCVFSGALFRLYNHKETSSVQIGEGCTFGTKLEMHANSGKKIIMGKDCMFSHDIELWAGDGHSIFDVKTSQNINSIYETQPNYKNLLVLGEHVWVGKRAFIMHGANIGRGSIIGASSVVKGKFPNNCTIAGSPATTIKTDTAWSRDMVTGDINRCGQGNVALTSRAQAPISGLNVLVIGGTRFMGIQLVWELLALGNMVTIATRGKTRDPFGSAVSRLLMDVSDAESTKQALYGRSFDVVFDNLAYCSINVKNILSNVKCKRYIQLSSIMVYTNFEMDIKEKLFDPSHIPVEECTAQVGYQKGKRQAEAIAYQNFTVPTATVRIPYVTKTDRLYYYCKHIVNQTPMKIDDMSKCITFIRDTEVGHFLPWLAAQDFVGSINLASEGYVTIQSIIERIEGKVHKKAIIDLEKGDIAPFNVFNERSFSLNMDKAVRLGYQTSNIHDWFWALLDEYINRAIKEA